MLNDAYTSSIIHPHPVDLRCGHVSGMNVYPPQTETLRLSLWFIMFLFPLTPWTWYHVEDGASLRVLSGFWVVTMSRAPLSAHDGHGVWVRNELGCLQQGFQIAPTAQHSISWWILCSFLSFLFYPFMPLTPRQAVWSWECKEFHSQSTFQVPRGGVSVIPEAILFLPHTQPLGQGLLAFSTELGKLRFREASAPSAGYPSFHSTPLPLRTTATVSRWNAG